MLYHVTFTTDHQALGFGETRSQVVVAEIARALAVQREGRMMGFWARADLGGVIFVSRAAVRGSTSIRGYGVTHYPNNDKSVWPWIE